jgi:lauroyl/myristoyl acyltransferase
MSAETEPVRHGAPPSRQAAPVPRRWTLHGLNNGLIFNATYRGVRVLPRAVSYGIGHVGTWIAWQSMTATRKAIADNLSVVFPDEARDALERRALATLRSYAQDTIDFLRALSSPPQGAEQMFEIPEDYPTLFDGLRAHGRGLILVTGHYGNWEAGSLLIRQALGLPLTIVAMAETNPQVNRIRREIRDVIGAETLEVRQSLETALQIRRRLAENHIVAMLVDRHYGRDRVPVSLFGRSAWLLRTPFLMAQATGAAVLPVFIERLGAGRFAPRLSAPILVSRERSRDDPIQEAAQQVADALAARVRAHPEYWYQFYRYWDAQRDAYEGLV